VSNRNDVVPAPSATDPEVRAPVLMGEIGLKEMTT
jgi:hypothetical protein